MDDFDTLLEGFDASSIKKQGENTTVNPSLLLATSNVIKPLVALPHRTGYVFDTLMKDHKPFTEVDLDHPEAPERIQGVYDTLKANKLIERMTDLGARPVTKEEACLVHTNAHWEQVQAIRDYVPEDFITSQLRYSHESLYISPETPKAAEISCGGAITAALAVARGTVRTAFAIVRPPGHHAEPEKPMGFCFFNNVAVAARVVQAQTNIKRILILDWDVHHGNGTQRAFYDDPNVLFISLHRYQGGEFYPPGPEGSMESCGAGAGLGKNINIPWPTAEMGDADYLYAFSRIILPVAYEFAPELVIISAGFDAAEGDPLGECEVTPAGFAHMAQALTALAGGKVVAMLEGGYDVDVISRCSLAVVKVLLGEPAPMLPSMVASPEATETIYQVALVQSKHWRSLHPRALEPSEEVQQDAMSVPDLLKAHRSYFMSENYDMHTVPFASESLEAAFSGQVIISPDLYDFQTMVVFVHDFGNIFAEVRNDLYCDLNLENSYMVDASRHVVEWCKTNNWGLIDINIFPKPHNPNAKGEQATVKQAVTYLWDNYIELSEASRVVLISHGSAMRAVVDLIMARSVRKLVKAVVQVASMHEPFQLLPSFGNDDIKAWFKEVSCLVVPEKHETLLTKLKPIERRYNVVQRIPETRVTKVFLAAMPGINEFVRSRVSRAPV